jgi:HK97 family phage prohead protease
MSKPDGRPEQRSLGTIEARSEEGAGTLVGYAAVFNSPTEIGTWFTEVIAPGAFAEAIRNDDVRALFNHRDSEVLGRTKAGTLRLSEDARGLRYEIDLPDTSLGKDLRVSIERGDITGSSFTFYAKREEWDETVSPPKRTVLEVELLDVGPVTFPAYPDTEVAMRCL